MTDRRRLKLALNALGSLIVGYFVVRAVADSWAILGDTISQGQWLPFLGCLGSAMVAMGWIAYVWVLLLRRHGGVLSAPLGLAVYFAGESTKYLPGAFWPVLGRGEIARRFGVPRSSAYPSVVYSLVLNFVLAGMVSSAITAPFVLSTDQPIGGASLVILLLPLGLVGLHPTVIEFALRAARRITGARLEITPLPWRSAVFHLVLYLPSWLFIGVAASLAARTIGIGPPTATLWFATYVAWVVGFLAVFAPTGLGVREAAFVAIVGRSVGNEVAAALAVLSRIAFVFADAAGAAVGFAIVGARARKTPIAEDHQDA